MALCANSGPEQSQQSTCTESLLDHLVGTGEQRGRNGEPNRVCSLHINKQVVLRCLIDRNVPWRCAIKDLSNAPRRTGPQLHIVERVGHETTVFDILAVRVNCRQSILLGQLDDQSAAHPAFHFVTHIDRVGVFLCVRFRTFDHTTAAPTFLPIQNYRAHFNGAALTSSSHRRSSNRTQLNHPPPIFLYPSLRTGARRPVKGRANGGATSNARGSLDGPTSRAGYPRTMKEIVTHLHTRRTLPTRVPLLSSWLDAASGSAPR